jgi:hypothetical protein
MQSAPSRLVKIFSTKTGELQHKIKAHGLGHRRRLQSNGQMLATADRNGGISIWDPDNAQELLPSPPQILRHRFELARRFQTPRLLK